MAEHSVQSTGSDQDIVAVLTDIWRNILGLEVIPSDGNFFELGGRSAAFVRAALQIEDRLQVEISLRDFFQNPTIDALAKRIVAARAS